MAIQIIGSPSVINTNTDVDGSAWVTPRPIGDSTLGHYRISRRFTPSASTTAGNLWCFRWTDSTRLAVISMIRLRGLQVGAPTAAVEDWFTAKIARSYTASDTTSSALISPTAAMQKMKTNMGNSLAEVRESTAAGGASAGTKTLDTDAFLVGTFWVYTALSSASGVPGLIMEYKPDIAAGEHPIVLATNEGFCVGNGNSMGTASGIILIMEMAWVEVLSY